MDALHNAAIERIDREGEANERAAYHRWMNRMAELDLTGRLDKATEQERATYASNLACTRARIDADAARHTTDQQEVTR